MDQDVLAVIVRGHRRNLPVNKLRALPARLSSAATRLTILLRLAALLHRGRVDTAPPSLKLRAKDFDLVLTLPAPWLETHPLTRADLAQEQDTLAAFGIKLSVRVE